LHDALPISAGCPPTFRGYPVRCQSRIVLSALPLARVCPSGENARLPTPSVCPRKVASSRRVATSHSLTLVSARPVASSLPSGENDTCTTRICCPGRAAPEQRGAPRRPSRYAATSHSLTALSALAEARILPSGENTRAW